MKKSIIKVGLLFLASSFLLTSCDGSGKSQEPEAVTATVKYSMPDRYDLSKLVDIKVYYTDIDGTEASEVVTTSTWEKTLTKAPVPGNYHLKVVYVRNDKPLEQESYKLGKGLALSYVTSNGKMESVNTAGFTLTNKSGVEEYIKRLTEEKSSIEVPE